MFYSVLKKFTSIWSEFQTMRLQLALRWSVLHVAHNLHLPFRFSFLLRTWTCVCDSRFSFNKPLNFYVLGFFNQFVVVCLGVSKIIIIMVKHQNRNFWVHKTRPMRAFSPVRESTFRFSLFFNYLEAKKKILFSINIINEYYINRHAHLNLFSLKYAQSTAFYSCSVLFFAYIMCPYKTKKVDFIASTHLLQS